ncbi:MAG: ATP-binding protein [Phascolarctobacterium sp.]|nr:ATP-binding protein [Phascolarctobacterium sp.]
MLLKYVVSNFKSIGRNVEFSMLPSDKEVEGKFLTILQTDDEKLSVLRRCAFFGPNASGKSTFAESLNFARNYITEPQKSSNKTGVIKFRGEFDNFSDSTLFQFVFFLDGKIYEYGFSLNSKQVVEEWLMVRKAGEFVELFTRVTDDNGITKIDIEDEFAIIGSAERELSDVLIRSMKEKQRNQLFLYKLKENGLAKAERVVNWFENIQVIFPDSKIQGLPIRVKEDVDFREFLSESLNVLDTGIVEVVASKERIDFHEFAEDMNMPIELVEAVENSKSGLISVNGKYFIFLEDEDTTSLIKIQFRHSLNNKNVKFNIDDESDGTQRLLDLLPILFKMEEKSNKIYIVDEIDRSLHTKLTKYILGEFLQRTESLNSQLIFTAHDINLMTADTMNKEEIWFIDKNKVGETTLRPFSDFETDESQSTIKDYLNGRFGAVPVIKGEYNA